MSRVSYNEILEFKGHQNSINTAAFSPDGRHLATGGDDYLLFIFDPFTGEVVHKLEGQAPVTAICWDPHEAGRLFVGYGTGRVLVAQANSVSTDHLVSNMMLTVDRHLFLHIISPAPPTMSPWKTWRATSSTAFTVFSSARDPEWNCGGRWRNVSTNHVSCMQPLNAFSSSTLG